MRSMDLASSNGLAGVYTKGNGLAMWGGDNIMHMTGYIFLWGRRGEGEGEGEKEGINLGLGT